MPVSFVLVMFPYHVPAATTIVEHDALALWRTGVLTERGKIRVGIVPLWTLPPPNQRELSREGRR
jgi:hypothetical protein